MRETDRATALLFRMSHEAKAALHREAGELGISVQALFERRMLGQVDAVDRRPGPAAARRRSHQDGLPLTG